MGINLGFTAMLFAVGLGIGGIFTAVPVLHTVLKIVGTAYLLYLAWRIASASASAAQTVRRTGR